MTTAAALLFLLASFPSARAAGDGPRRLAFTGDDMRRNEEDLFQHPERVMKALPPAYAQLIRSMDEKVRKQTPEQRSAIKERQRQRAQEARRVFDEIFPTLTGKSNALQTGDMDQDGSKRRYWVHVPAGSDSAKPLPVVLDFCPGEALAQLLEVNRMNAAADKLGFIAVYPLPSRAPGADEASFVRVILEELPKRHAIDPRRVYAAGGGAGGELALATALRLSGRIAAAGAVMAALPQGPAPERPVPIVYFGAPRSLAAPGLDWWLKTNRCRMKPAAQGRSKDVSWERFEPAQGKDGAAVLWYRPGQPWSSVRPGTDARALMWRFFESKILLK